MTKIKIAVQLYSVRDALEKDFFGTLRRIRDIGYEGVEFAGFYGHSASEIKDFLIMIDLKPVSSHVHIDSLLVETVDILKYHNQLGCPFIAVPWLDEPRRPGSALWDVTVSQISKIAQECESAGIQLLYHNHDFEFTVLNGRYALDLLYEAIRPDLLGTEIDTCWVKVSGLDPAKYLRQYKGRSPIIHLKDFIMIGGAKGKDLYALIDESGKDIKTATVDHSSFDFRPLGMGLQDIPSILVAAADAGTQWVVVEQDRSSERPPMEAIKLSRVYLKSLGL